MKYIILSIQLLCIVSLYGQSIAIDGRFDDWANVPLLAEDLNDQMGGGVGIDRVWMTDDEDYVYVSYELSRATNLQDGELVTINFDSDNMSNTGFPKNGIGIEYTYFYNTGNGILNVGNGNLSFDHGDAGIYCAPNVKASRFESAFKKSTIIGSNAFEFGNKIKLYLENNTSAADKLPNEGKGGLLYTMIRSPKYSPSNYSIEKFNSSHLRILSYNVERDGLFATSTGTPQRNLLSALKPDIMAFQEIYNNNDNAILNLANTLFPRTAPDRWYVHKGGTDVALVSKYPILNTYAIDGNTAFLLKLDQTKTMVVVNVHFPCCDNNTARQAEIDNVISFIRRVMKDKQLFQTNDSTSIVILGDMNLVGDNQLEPLLRGDIQDEAGYGKDYKMDRDGSDLEDAFAFVNNTNLTYTWYNGSGKYLPGRLDFILYSGSVLFKENSFVFDTKWLKQSQLQDYNLNVDETRQGSDHIPIVADFSFDVNILPLTLNTKIASYDCKSNKGKVQLEPLGGKSPYSFYVNDIAVSSPFEIEANTSYEVKVKDRTNMVSTTTFRLDYSPIVINVTVSDDQVVLDAKGGMPPLTATINTILIDLDKISTVSNSGIYNLAIKDQYCTKDTTITIAIDKDDDGVAKEQDCDDTNAAINPNAVEIPNNTIDENCDGILLILDEDKDGYNSTEDCDDTNAAINPNAVEIPNNGVDEDCKDGDLITSIKDKTNDGLITYTNPVVNNLIVRGDNSKSKFKINLYSTTGILLHQSEMQYEHTIDMSVYQSGIYIVKIYLTEKIVTKKILKQ